MSSKLALSLLILLSFAAGVPALADEHKYFSKFFGEAEDPRGWEANLRNQIGADEQGALISPPQAQQLYNELTQIQQEHQSYLNQNGTPNGNNLTPGERAQIKEQIANVNRQRQDMMSEHGGRKNFVDIFAKEDPRDWENSLRQRIYNDEKAGLLIPTQAQFRINQVNQVQQEHQQWLNQNGAPAGNVLSAGERKTIREQLDAVNREVEDDIHHGSGRR